MNESSAIIFHHIDKSPRHPPFPRTFPFPLSSFPYLSLHFSTNSLSLIKPNPLSLPNSSLQIPIMDQNFDTHQSFWQFSDQLRLQTNTLANLSTNDSIWSNSFVSRKNNSSFDVRVGAELPSSTSKPKLPSDLNTFSNGQLSLFKLIDYDKFNLLLFFFQRVGALILIQKLNVKLYNFFQFQFKILSAT